MLIYTYEKIRENFHRVQLHFPKASTLNSRQGQDFSLLHSVHKGSGAQPASYLLDSGGSFPEVKLPEHEAHHLPQSSGEAKNGRGISPLPPYVFMT
jgi:hypothetical protein